MAGGEQGACHLRMVQAYSSTVPQLAPDESVAEQRTAWWSLADDGYAYENITRHLVGAGQYTQLVCLLCDCLLSVRRMDIGGWAALDQDFHRLFSSSSHTQHTEHAAMRNVHRLLSRSWHAVSRHRSLFAFNVFRHLSRRERSAECIAAYLASVEKYHPWQWLHLLTRCVGPRDDREVSRWDLASTVLSVCVSWSIQRVYIASGSDIQVWCIKSQQQLFVMEGHTGEVRSVAISSDGKRIVSGSDDNTVRRWDADTELPMGDAMKGRKGFDVLENTRAQARGEEGDFGENGIDVFSYGTVCRSATSDGRKIVLGLPT